MNPREYLEIKKRVELKHHQLDQILADALESAKEHPFPENVRLAVAEDIVVDQVLWCYFDTPHWLIVDEVLNPHDKFKAFLSDGCRYGLDDSFVEVE